MDELLDIGATAPELRMLPWGVHGPISKKFISAEEVKLKFSQLQDSVRRIVDHCHSIAEHYLQIGYLLTCIEDNETYCVVFKTLGYGTYSDIQSFALAVFGFSRTLTYNLLAIARQFAVLGEVKSEYKDYSYSKLIELLPISNERRGAISADMSVRDIRDLRTIWDKYGYDKKQTGKEALRRGRERMASESGEEREKKAQEKNAGLLALLNADQETGETVTAIELPKEEKAVSETKKLGFKNDTERKAFLSAANCQKWPLYIDIPQLDLTFRKYEFQNGDSIIAEFGHEYTWEKKYTSRFRLHLQTCDKPEFDCNGIAETYVLEYLKSHKDEI